MSQLSVVDRQLRRYMRIQTRLANGGRHLIDIEIFQLRQLDDLHLLSPVPCRHLIRKPSYWCEIVLEEGFKVLRSGIVYTRADRSTKKVNDRKTPTHVRITVYDVAQWDHLDGIGPRTC